VLLLLYLLLTSFLRLGGLELVALAKAQVTVRLQLQLLSPHSLLQPLDQTWKAGKGAVLLDIPHVAGSLLLLLLALALPQGQMVVNDVLRAACPQLLDQPHNVMREAVAM